MDKKVNFIIIGAAKSGTTTLYDYLAKHSKIYMPELKEPCYFDNTMLNGHEPYKGWHKGVEWYNSLFSDADRGQLLGEASTNYTRYPQLESTPKRIYEYNKDMKLIYIMREPVARAYSHYVHRCLKELKLNPPFQTGFLEHLENDPMCIDSSKYALQLSQYYKFFQRDSILLLSFSELTLDPKKVVSQTLEFLGLEHESQLVESSLLSNDSSAFRDTKERELIAERYRSSALFSSIAKLIPIPRVRSILYAMLKKLPSNRQITNAIIPPKISESDKIFLAKSLKDDVDQLDKEYEFKDESW